MSNNNYTSTLNQLKDQSDSDLASLQDQRSIVYAVQYAESPNILIERLTQLRLLLQDQVNFIKTNPLLVEGVDQ